MRILIPATVLSPASTQQCLIASSPPVIIIDATLSRRFFTTRDPQGHRIKLGGPDSTAPWMTIVGVAAEVKHYGLDQTIRPGFYLPHTQHPYASLTMTVRTSVADPGSVATALCRSVHELDPDLPVSDLRTMPEVVNRSCWAQRLIGWLFGLFSALGITLTAVGIYGVMAYSVAQRAHEIGVRMALGARRADVLKLVVRQGMGAVGLGMILGLLVFHWLTGWLGHIGAALQPAESLKRVLKGALGCVAAVPLVYLMLSQAKLVSFSHRGEARRHRSQDYGHPRGPAGEHAAPARRRFSRGRGSLQRHPLAVRVLVAGGSDRVLHLATPAW